MTKKLMSIFQTFVPPVYMYPEWLPLLGGQGCPKG